jgi:hypothetical protein
MQDRTELTDKYKFVQIYLNAISYFSNYKGNTFNRSELGMKGGA